MKILILGYSDIAQRKVIPAIQKLSSVKEFEVASLSRNIPKLEKLSFTFSDYDYAVKNSNADIVYISLPNHLHYKYSKYSLNNNKNVISEKPAIFTHKELNSLFHLSNEKGLAIGISCVFEYHKGWRRFKEISQKNSNEGVLIAEFTIPELSSTNIRMSKSLKGGAFNDMGIYASTIGNLFWNTNIKNGRIQLIKNKDLIQGFSVLLNYGKNKNLLGNFGFNQVYTNQVQFSTQNTKYIYEKVFSQSIDHESKIIKLNLRNRKEVDVGKDNSFYNYFDFFVNNLKNKTYLNKKFYNMNLEYLKAMELI
jgi:dTDP-3,4-didehydro-2,6-dideoxy-alpha-D-glucose 3-reductase